MKLKYQQLTDYLIAHLPKHYHANVYSWLLKGNIADIGRQQTAYGVILGQIQSQVIIWLENFPFRQIDPAYVMALINIWLDENDPDRDRLDQYEVSFEITPIDDHSVDLEFSLEFVDHLEAVADENGHLTVQTDRLRLAPIEIWTATSINVEAKNRWQAKRKARGDNA